MLPGIIFPNTYLGSKRILIRSVGQILFVYRCFYYFFFLILFKIRLTYLWSLLQFFFLFFWGLLFIKCDYKIECILIAILKINKIIVICLSYIPAVFVAIVILIIKKKNLYAEIRCSLMLSSKSCLKAFHRFPAIYQRLKYFALAVNSVFGKNKSKSFQVCSSRLLVFVWFSMLLK